MENVDKRLLRYHSVLWTEIAETPKSVSKEHAAMLAMLTHVDQMPSASLVLMIQPVLAQLVIQATQEFSA